MKKAITYLLAAIAAAGAYAAAPDQVARVRSGELKEARASWWGFDADDSTTALQAAINSGVPRLIVERQASAWITEPLKLVSNQEIVFESGVEVLAKEGSFKGTGDSLMLLSCVSNVTLRGTGATLRMRRADYDAPPYRKAEWRHVLSIRGCQNIKVYGLTLAESGGDGIYLGSVTGAPSNKDIHIKDVTCDKNYRQGISVISAENLLIEDTVMRDTAGTPPAAGIDFEPNSAKERLKNIVMRRCLTSNNAGDGYEFYLPNLNQQSEPVSIQIENCRSVGDRTAVRVVTANSKADAVRGALVFSDCEFKDAVRGGIELARKPDYGMALAFDRCAVAGCGAGQSNQLDITLSNRNGDVAAVGGIRFKELRVVQPTSRPWIGWRNNIFDVESVTGLTGDVVVICGSQTQRIALTPEWVKAKFPPRFNVRVARVEVDWKKLDVKDEIDGLHPLEPMRVRGQGSYIFHATANREVVLKGVQQQVGRYGETTKPVVISGLDGKTLKSSAMLAFKQELTIQFSAPQTGFYRLEFDAGQNSFLLQAANVPVALDATVQPVKLIGSQGTLYVAVPAEVKLFAFAVSGNDGEGVKASVIDPSGSVAWLRESLFDLDRFTFDGNTAQSGLWRIKLERPAAGGFEDYSVDVLGVPGCLFLNPKRIWH
ncbi:MAG: right-handed parallel beta-helix repeat-containing protein [Kiritimatiellae bacterium]|nr:right-handed parallel beta-helix repeat-containing protein [Kiritimatiellia bacterium]